MTNTEISALLAAAQRLASLLDDQGGISFPSRGDCTRAREAISAYLAVAEAVEPVTWHSISEPPVSMSVLARFFDNELGEWVYTVFDPGPVKLSMAGPYSEWLPLDTFNHPLFASPPPASSPKVGSAQIEAVSDLALSLGWKITGSAIRKLADHPALLDPDAPSPDPAALSPDIQGDGALISHRMEEAGFVEFLNEDVPTIVRDIEGKVAIHLDLNTRKVVGYRVYDPGRSHDPPSRKPGNPALGHRPSLCCSSGAGELCGVAGEMTLELPDTVTPEDLAKHMGWSPRRVKTLARAIGACRIMGNRMALTKADVDAILEASRPCPSPSRSAAKSGTIPAPLPGGDYEALRRLRRNQKPSVSPTRSKAGSSKVVAIRVLS